MLKIKKTPYGKIAVVLAVLALLLVMLMMIIRITTHAKPLPNSDLVSMIESDDGETESTQKTNPNDDGFGTEVGM